MGSKLTLLVAVVYGIIESLEKIGLPKKYAHILALPLGILGSYLLLPCSSIADHLIYGIFIGFASAGTCDTFGNILAITNRENNC